jgi:hypothetical protein
VTSVVAVPLIVSGTSLVVSGAAIQASATGPTPAPMPAPMPAPNAPPAL